MLLRLRRSTYQYGRQHGEKRRTLTLAHFLSIQKQKVISFSSQDDVRGCRSKQCISASHHADEREPRQTGPKQGTRMCVTVSLLDSLDVFKAHWLRFHPQGQWSELRGETIISNMLRMNVAVLWSPSSILFTTTRRASIFRLARGSNFYHSVSLPKIIRSLTCILVLTSTEL